MPRGPAGRRHARPSRKPSVAPSISVTYGRRVGGIRRIRNRCDVHRAGAIVMPRKLRLGVDQPALERVLGDRLDLYRHKGVIDAADLVALTVIGARTIDFHPALVEPPDDRVLLHPEGWYEPAVNHIGPGYRHPDDRVGRNHERV